jgi:hypothetical protein
MGTLWANSCFILLSSCSLILHTNCDVSRAYQAKKFVKFSLTVVENLKLPLHATKALGRRRYYIAPTRS